MKLFAMMAAVALLAGCASSVKLDDVPVVDATGAAVGQGGQVGGGSGAGVGNGGITRVDLNPAGMDKAGPMGVAKVVYFDYDAFTIKSEYQPLIEAHARYLKSSASRKVVIEGHTDDTGGREYNLALGQKRSESVKNALGLMGVADQSVEAISFGKEKPASNGTDDEARAKNRRAELSYR